MVSGAPASELVSAAATELGTEGATGAWELNENEGVIASPEDLVSVDSTEGLEASEEELAGAPNVKDGLGASEEGLAGAPNVKGGLASVEPNAGVAAGGGTSPAAFSEEKG